MLYKKVSTVLLVVAAAAMLVTLAFKIRVGTDILGKGGSASKGCCGNSGGGCAAKIQNQAKGE